MSNFNYVVTAFSLFVNGVGKAGSGEKCSLPKIMLATEEFRGGGMMGSMKVPYGFKDMDLSFELNQFDPQVMALSDPINNRNMTFSIRGFATGDGANGTSNASHTIIFQGTGVLEENDPGEWSAGKKAILKGKVALSAAKLTVDGAEMYNIDVRNDVYVIGGTDIYAPVRQALGL